VGSLTLAVCTSIARAQVWSCDRFDVDGLLYLPGEYDEAYGALACSTDSWAFSEVLGGGVSAVGGISHQSDGDSTAIQIELDLTDPTGDAHAFLYAFAYFYLDFDEATLVSFEYDVQHVQGTEGSISILGVCDDPNGTGVSVPGGIDFYFGPGGGSCYVPVEAGISVGSPGSYESLMTITGTSSPLPITPSLAVEIIDEEGDGDEDLYLPWDLGVDSNGNVFVTSIATAGVFGVGPSGVISQLLGVGGTYALAVGANDDVYVADAYTRAWRITPGVGFTEIIGSTGDGAGNVLVEPADIAVDLANNAFVAGRFSENVFKITPGGTITVIIDYSGDGVNPLGEPAGLDVDAAGNVYVSTRSDNVFKVTPGGTITRIIDASGDGAGNVLDGAHGIAVSPSGDVYVAGRDSDNAFHITPTGTITQVLDATGNGSGHVCDYPMRIVLDPAQNLYVACYASYIVVQVAPDGTVTELMDATGDGAANPMGAPHGLDYRDGRLYVTGVSTNNAFRITLVKQVPMPWAAGVALAALILSSTAAYLRQRRVAR
jgi:hypothetical protein